MHVWGTASWSLFSLPDCPPGERGLAFHGEQGGEAAVSRQPLPSGPTGAWGTGTTDFQGQVTDLVQPKGVVLT